MIEAGGQTSSRPPSQTGGVETAAKNTIPAENENARGYAICAAYVTDVEKTCVWRFSDELAQSSHIGFIPFRSRIFITTHNEKITIRTTLDANIQDSITELS